MDLLRESAKVQPSKTELCQEDRYYGRRGSLYSNNSALIQWQQALFIAQIYLSLDVKHEQKASANSPDMPLEQNITGLQFK